MSSPANCPAPSTTLRCLPNMCSNSFSLYGYHLRGKEFTLCESLPSDRSFLACRSTKAGVTASSVNIPMVFSCLSWHSCLLELVLGCSVYLTALEPQEFVWIIVATASTRKMQTATQATSTVCLHYYALYLQAEFLIDLWHGYSLSIFSLTGQERRNIERIKSGHGGDMFISFYANTIFVQSHA